ncbi:MAG: hypothetical protein JOY80_03440 [Candidatus Dormibacteraeota bacterium]|nr:hypothetical protein [Candidatus Dormibacteraeota bacterium]
MGFMDKIREMGGGVSPELLQNGILARGEVLNIQQTGMQVSHGEITNTRQVCDVLLAVYMDNTPEFQATVHQGIPVLLLQQMASGNAVVAVRVDPNDHSKVAIDFDSEVPTVTLAAGQANVGSAAQLLETGTPVRAVIIATEALGVKSSKSGEDMYAFQVTILCDGQAPYQTQMGNPVPDNAKPLLFPGANLPAKADLTQKDHVAIDWAAAVEEFSHTKA